MPLMLSLSVILGLLFSWILGFAVAWLWLKNSSSNSSKDFIKLKAENDLILKEKNRLLSENQSYQEKEKNYIEKASSLQTQNEELRKNQIKQEQGHEKNLNREKSLYEDKLQDQKNYYEEKLQSQKEEFDRQSQTDKQHYEEKEQHFKELAQKTKVEFENVAQKIFQENTKSYKEESSKNLTQILTPFKENIEGFKKSIQSFENKEESLDKTIKDFININTDMRDGTIKLTQALEGNSKTLGQWGEFMLANILEKSGLRKGDEFILQGQGMELQSPEGDLAKPDAIVLLPDNKHIIIDSKVSSLAPWTEYLSAETEQEKDKLLTKTLNSVRGHIDNLSSKQYNTLKGLNSPDFVLMFMPNESLFALAIQQGKQDLFDRAWKKNIVIVSPTTLLATLRTVASIWKIERQNKNAEEIARLGGSLYDKFIGFLDEMQDLKKGLDNAQKYYDKALVKLQTGRGHLIGKAEKMKELGAKTNKNLAPHFQITKSQKHNLTP